MNNKPNYNHILIISPRKACYEGLASVLTKHLDRPRFTFLNQLTDKLPDKQFDWSNIDLIIIDISKRKREIYEWYSPAGFSNRIPPAIVLGYPAKYKDAGFFLRAGALDYLNLEGLKTSQLLQSLVIVSEYIKERRLAVANTDNQKDSDTSLQHDMLETGEMEMWFPPESKKSGNEETREEFINTGIMDILQREELRKIVEKQDSD
jgi:hypothetical protein